MEADWGEFGVRPIKVVRQIETEVKPASTSVFACDWVIILKFPGKSSAKEFAPGESFERLSGQYAGSFTAQTTFLSKRMKALPGMPDFPLISDKILHPRLAFILLNSYLLLRK